MNNIKPKTFVGILIMTNVYTHEKTSEKELVAILQRRGKVSDEDNTSFKWERYSGFCEVTSYGKMEANETIEETLMREVSEELGSKVAKMIKKYDKKILFEKVNNKGEKYCVFCTLLPSEVFGAMQLDVSTGGIEIIRKSDIKKIKETYFGKSKKSISDLKDITLWELPVSVLKKSFEMFS